MIYKNINDVSIDVALRLEKAITVRKKTVASAKPRKMGGS